MKEISNLEKLKKLYSKLRKLCDEGKGEEQEADDIRDECDIPAQAMTPEENKLFVKWIRENFPK